MRKMRLMLKINNKIINNKIINSKILINIHNNHKDNNNFYKVLVIKWIFNNKWVKFFNSPFFRIMYSIIINSNYGNKIYKDFNNKKIYKIKEGTINLTNNL